MAKALVVLGHPLDSSLCGHFADIASASLAAAGHDVDMLDLARQDFDPRLSAAERVAYYAPPHDFPGVSREAALLSDAEILVLVFPTWWFSPPALMKGFIDRVFAPAIAFDHGVDFGPIRPRLDRLRKAVVVTTLGSPWWVDWLVMRRPVRRMFKWAVFKACAPRARFDYLAFYAAEKPEKARVAAFTAKLREALG